MATRTLSRKGSNGRRRVLKGNQSFGIDADLSGLNAFLGELEEAAAEALRPAAQAATQVLYDRVRLNVQALGRETATLSGPSTKHSAPSTLPLASVPNITSVGTTSRRLTGIWWSSATCSAIATTRTTRAECDPW